MAPETIRLVSEASTFSQVRTKIETLFAALDSLRRAKDGRVISIETIPETKSTPPRGNYKQRQRQHASSKGKKIWRT